jgi:hypothetical protein
MVPEDFDLCRVVDLVENRQGSEIEAAAAGLSDPAIVQHFLARKAAMQEAFAQATKDAINANAIASGDQNTTTDRGFLEADARLQAFFALPAFAK